MKIEDRPTPETEKLVERWDYSPLPKVMEAHARTLERQRDALREALEACLAPLQDEYNRTTHTGHGTAAAYAFVSAKAALAATNPTP